MTITRLTPFIATSSDAAVPAPARIRAARLAPPRVVGELTPYVEPALADVDAFVDQLVELPASEWVRIGRIIASDAVARPVRRRAWIMVDDAITDHRAGGVAWYVRDAVETAAFLASRGATKWPRDGRSMFAAAHGAAEAAALALLVRRYLNRDSLCLLCAPFATLLPDVIGNE